MSKSILDNLRYRIEWQDAYVERYSGYLPNMSHYHMHSYYEVSLILSGDVTVMVGDRVERGRDVRILLLPPYTMHYILPEPHLEYRRVNVLFTREFLERAVPEWEKLLAAFAPGGAILSPSDAALAPLLEAADRIDAERDPFRRKLELLLFLSKLPSCETQREESSIMPDYLAQALTYIAGHYPEPITAASLSRELGIGRTTLLTAMRRYTGETLSTYLARIRLRAAMALLQKGESEARAAEAVGLGSSCNFIRVFRRHFGETPKRYRGGI